MKAQKVWIIENDYTVIKEYLVENNIKSILLVCGGSFDTLPVGKYIKACANELGIRIVVFSEFSPNPKYEAVIKGTALLKKEQCDLLMAVGGGSAIDVAKCMKLYYKTDCSTNFFEQEAVSNNLPFLVVPTTAGTGSEVTRYAVIYYNGEKQSIVHDSCLPDAVVLDASVLTGLPEYQRKATMLDALCHAIESFWSIHSTEESKEYSRQAIKLILDNRDSYLKNCNSGNINMLLAANFAGKAINITQTTAGHAMCYKLTGLYSFAHGHAAALCVTVLWEYMLRHMEKCIDKRGKEYLDGVFQELALLIGEQDCYRGADAFRELFLSLKLEKPSISAEELNALKQSVNPTRLRNNPINLSESDIECLYNNMTRLDR